VIRINLLPPELRKRRRIPILDMTLIYLVFAIILLIFILNFITAQQKNKIKSLDQQIAETKAEIAHYQEIINLVKDIEAVRQKISSRVSVIEELEKRRFYWVDRLTRLAQALPDYVWLSGVYDEKEKVSLKGSSFSIKSIATFMIQILKGKVFDELSLSFIRESQSEVGKTYYFEMFTKATPPQVAAQPQPKPEEQKKESGVLGKIQKQIADTAQIRKEAAGLK